MKPTHHSSTATAAPRRPLRVLFVEDSSADVELCRRALESAGYELEVEVVDSAAEFSRRLDSGDYDIILSDFNLPAWNGLEALKALRQRRRDIPFVLVTGSLGEETAVEAIHHGAADFIIKDRLARLPMAVRRALEQKSLREERERAEEARRLSEEKFEKAFRASPDTISLSTLAEGRYLEVNDSFVRLSGYTREEIIGHTVEELGLIREPGGRARLLEAVRTHGCANNVEMQFISKDGVSRAGLVSAEVIEMAGEQCLLTIGRDITERKRAEEARREATEKLRAILDASPVAITMLDLQGRVRSWNRGAERVFGWSESEVLGQPLPTIPEGKSEEFANLLSCVLAGESLTGMELRRRRKDGSPIDIVLSTAPLYSSAGSVSGLVGAMSDITEQKQLQEQLRQAQKMEAVGRLAGGIAHDFNNLLGVIKGYSEIALGRLPAEDPLRRPLGEVQRAADRAAALTRQLLAFSRRQVLEPRVLSLNDTIAGLRGMFERLLPESIELTVELESDLGRVKVDPSQIEQVIMNLVLNARDAMPQGGRLMLETHNIELDDTYSRRHLNAPPGPYVILSVSDTGIGMDAETLSHVFEPFFSTKEKGKGTGLGLATVYGIVKQSGGYIWAYSEPGRGSTFKVYLPRVQEAAEVRHLERAADTLPRGTETVLVVEDEEGLRTLAREFLETCGYSVLEARDGVEALEVVRRNDHTIHLLLTDVVLPRLSGRDLATQLAALRPEVKVLYMSGYTDRAILQNGALEPGLAFLQKPFSLRALAAKIREVLDA